MNAFSSRRRLGAVVLTAAATFAVAVPSAAAAPAPVNGRQSASRHCPEVRDVAARLRAHGLTAQAANVLAQLTVRDCRRAR